MSNALISLKPQYVKSILKGEKTVELRRGSVNLPPGTRLWIYSTLPSGCIAAFAEIDFIQADSPQVIWEKYSSEVGITQTEYNAYVLGRDKVTAITLKAITKIEPTISLNYLREQLNSFHPPQFFQKLSSDNPLLNFLQPLINQKVCKGQVST